MKQLLILKNPSGGNNLLALNNGIKMVSTGSIVKVNQLDLQYNLTDKPVIIDDIDEFEVFAEKVFQDNEVDGNLLYYLNYFEIIVGGVSEVITHYA